MLGGQNTEHLFGSKARKRSHSELMLVATGFGPFRSFLLVDWFAIL
jgi:hypothetical protein